MRSRVLLLLAGATLVLASCGGDGGNGDPGNGGADGTAPPAATDTADDGEDGDSGETRIAMEDNVFVPATLTVAAGAELELDNEGENPHTFTIEEAGIDVEVPAGENGETTVDLDPGSYEFICRFHEAQGMTGTLEVSG